MSRGSRQAENLLTGIGLGWGFAGGMLFQGLDIRLEPGQIIIIGGDNGSGKTTLLRILAGLIPPLEGEIKIAGVPLGDDRVRAAARVVFIGHRNGLATEMTALEAIRFWGQMRGLAPSLRHLEAAFESLDLADCMRRPLRVLSAGQRRRCAMVRLALIGAMSVHETVPLWLLDEPTTAMDENASLVFAKMLAHHASKGGGVIAASHLVLPVNNAHHLRLPNLKASP